MNWCVKEQHNCGYATSYGKCGVTACVNKHLQLREVVLCRDCVHCSVNRYHGTTAFCDLGIGILQLDGYCSRGERK